MLHYIIFDLTKIHAKNVIDGARPVGWAINRLSHIHEASETEQFTSVLNYGNQLSKHAGSLVSLMNVAPSILFNSSYTFQSAKWAGQRGGPIRVWVQCPVPGGKRRSLGHDLVDCQTSIWQTGLRLQRQARAVSRCSRQLHAVLKLVLQAVWIQNCQPIQKTGQNKVWRAILWKKVKLLIVKEIF